MKKKTFCSSLPVTARKTSSGQSLAVDVADTSLAQRESIHAARETFKSVAGCENTA